MNSSPETPQPQPNPEIQLGQQIFPFGGGFPIKELPNSGTGSNNSYDVSLGLRLPFKGENISVPIGFSLWDVKSTGLSIAPFHPEAGYQITQEDMDEGSRKEKISKLAKVPEDFDPVAPQILYISITGEDIVKLGFGKYHGTNDIDLRVDSEFLQLLSSLKCIVNANGMYISNGHAVFLDRSNGTFDFNNFFLDDSGPLKGEDESTISIEDETAPDGEKTILIGEGHPLTFSGDENERKQIGIEFILDPLGQGPMTPPSI